MSREVSVASGKTVKPISPAQARVAKPIVKLMSRLNVWLHRVTSGRVGGRFPGGAPVCFVTIKGRKTGRYRTIPLIHIPHGDDVLLIASLGGMDDHPVWYWNLKANPEIEVQAGGRNRAMKARPATPEEKKELWPVATAVYPDYDDYQARTERDICLFICSPR